MARTVVRIAGLSELNRALGELPKATGKAVLLRVLRDAAEPVAAAMRARAPSDPTDELPDIIPSIGVGTKLSDRQARLHKKMFRDDRAAAEMFVGVGKIPHSHLQEWGTAHHAAQPFARPAWDATKDQALDIVAGDLGDEIAKAAKRLAKKAAKG